MVRRAHHFGSTRSTGSGPGKLTTKDRKSTKGFVCEVCLVSGVSFARRSASGSVLSPSSRSRSKLRRGSTVRSRAKPDGVGIGSCAMLTWLLLVRQAQGRGGSPPPGGRRSDAKGRKKDKEYDHHSGQRRRVFRHGRIYDCGNQVVGVGGLGYSAEGGSSTVGIRGLGYQEAWADDGRMGRRIAIGLEYRIANIEYRMQKLKRVGKMDEGRLWFGRLTILGGWGIMDYLMGARS